MLPPKTLLTAFTALNLVLSGMAVAAPTTYQVTGPVLEVTDSTIVVQKGKERWEVQRDANTKVTGELKVGAKVTISYTMTAVTAEVKAGKPEKAGVAPAAPAKP